MIVICALALAPANPTIASESLTAEAQRNHISRLIAEYFPDDYWTMKAVANCESTGLVHRLSDGSLIPNLEGSTARGVFQVLMSVHAEAMENMGLNPNDDRDYMTYVRHLYDEFGLRPWKASQHCWQEEVYASS
jgi:hypothetical protein